MKRFFYLSMIVFVAFLMSGPKSASAFFLTVSSTSYGSVTDPGEGVFHYPYLGMQATLVATPDNEDCQFVRWECSDPDLISDPYSATTTVTGWKNLTVTAYFVWSPYEGPPECSTYPAKSITNGSASLRGGLLEDGNSSNEYRFYYWVEGGPKMTTDWDGPLEQDEVGSVIVTTLQPGTTYHFEMETRNDFGTALGSVRQFTTLGEASEAWNPLDILYVDDDALTDPGPGNIAVSDPLEDGSQAHPFDSIQQAIARAKPQGVQILVRSGRYYENLDFLGKGVALTSSTEPNTPNDLVFPVIDGGYTGPVVTFANGEQIDSLLRGFVLTGGLDEMAAAIRCESASPSIANCLIVGNRAMGSFGGAVYCVNSRAVFTNCTIADNYTGDGAAMVFVGSQKPIIKNSILWNNVPRDLLNMTLLEDLFFYNDSSNALWPSHGNIVADPAFVASGVWVDRSNPTIMVAPTFPGALWIAGDYHLLSQVGRWDPMIGLWVMDASVTSPCIDAADPLTSWASEIGANGGRANMGAYGGTTQASWSN